MSFHGIQAKGWYRYRRELFGSQHRKNFPRCNKAFMTAGVECRLPFLNTQLVELALSLSEEVVRDGGGKPKAVLQEAFVGQLPDSVVRRPKLAFQDGLGVKPEFAAVIRGDPRAAYVAAYRAAYPLADLGGADLRGNVSPDPEEA